MVLDGNRRRYGRQSHVVTVITRWSWIVLMGAWMLMTNPALASHVTNDGLPQKPSLNQSQEVKAFNWHLYAQGRYTKREGSGGRISLRRVKLNIGGHLIPHGQFFVQGLYKDGNDSPTDDRPSIQDAWLAYNFKPFLRLSIGQFKPPFGMERFTSDARIYTIDRSQATDHLVPNGKLDDSFTRGRGFQLDGWGKSERLYYAIGFFEGEGANNPIDQFSPMLTTRMTYQVLEDRLFHGHTLHLHVGGAFSVRDANDLDLGRCCPGPQSVALQSFNGRDLRWNAELAGDWGGTSLRAEYFQARFHFRDSSPSDFSADGWYVQAAQFFGHYVQAAVKIEGFNPNTSFRDKNDILWTTLGVNVYLDEDRAKVMVDYVFKQEKTDSFNNDTLLVQFQYFFK